MPACGLCSLSNSKAVKKKGNGRHQQHDIQQQLLSARLHMLCTVLLFQYINIHKIRSASATVTQTDFILVLMIFVGIPPFNLPVALGSLRQGIAPFEDLAVSQQTQIIAS